MTDVPAVEWVLGAAAFGGGTDGGSEPSASQGSFADTSRDVLDWAGLSPEEHCQWFRRSQMAVEDWPLGWGYTTAEATLLRGKVATT